jgi:hypothetical protein
MNSRFVELYYATMAAANATACDSTEFAAVTIPAPTNARTNTKLDCIADEEAYSFWWERRQCSLDGMARFGCRKSNAQVLDRILPAARNLRQPVWRRTKMFSKDRHNRVNFRKG